MAVTRQDAWSEDDDLLLAEVTLRHIREGSTQLTAFEEVGYRLNRTAAACGFRWNSLIRKKYESAIQIAKAQRQQLKARNKNRLVLQQESGVNMLIPQQGSYKPTYSQEFAMEESLPSIKQENHRVEQVSFDDVIRILLHLYIPRGAPFWG